MHEVDEAYAAKGAKILNSSLYTSELKLRSNTKIKMPTGVKPPKYISSTIPKYADIDHGEKILYEFVYDGGIEFYRNGIITNNSNIDAQLKVVFVATDRRLLKIRYFINPNETIDQIDYDYISTIYLDNQSNNNYYQITMNANKTVIKRNDEDGEYDKQRDSFKIKPVKWRIPDVTNPDTKNLVAVIKENMAGKNADIYPL